MRAKALSPGVPESMDNPAEQKGSFCSKAVVVIL